MRIIFSKGSGLNDSIYGKCQAPIKMFLEKRGEAYEQQSVIKELFKMSRSENFGDMLTSMTAMNGFEPVGENGAYPMDSMQEGYKKLMTYETWKDSFSVSKELMEDSKLMDLTRRPEAFMTSYGRTRELFGATLFGGAIQGLKAVKFGSEGRSFDAACADGLPLFHNAHPGKATSRKQCNIFSDAFSVDALGQMETHMHLFRGDSDEVLDVAPTTILIPADATLQKEVFAAIGADKEPATSNNAFNYQYGRWTVIVWPYLSQVLEKQLKAGLKPWVLLDSAYNKLYGGAVWTDRVPLEVRSTVDENTDANVWRGRSRFGAGFFDWRFACVGGIDGADALPV